MFSVKSIVQCSDELDHKIDLKLRKKSTADQSYVIKTYKSQFHTPIIPFLPPADQKGPPGRPKWPTNQ